MFCYECGCMIPPGSAFCPECGAPVRVQESGMQNTPPTPQPIGMASQPLVMIQCVRGTLQGTNYPVRGEVIIGSQQGMAHVIVPNACISRQHVSIRFNGAANCFEVKDLSTNGTYFSNGSRMRKGVYTSCPRGTVIWIGSQNEQFKLV